MVSQARWGGVVEFPNKVMKALTGSSWMTEIPQNDPLTAEMQSVTW